MARCCGQPDFTHSPAADPCAAPPPVCVAGTAPAPTTAPAQWFAHMIEHCLDYATAAQRAGRPIVGIMCEFTPRELILAAGGVPVCLCGGSEKAIGPAEEHLPANLCPLIKSTFGYHVTGKNPFLEMADLIVAETTCDGKKKMFELMGQTRPMYVLELPQKPDDPDAFAHWGHELEKLKAHLETQFGTWIDDAALRDAIALMNRERSLRRTLAGFMALDPPALTGRQLLDYKSSISGIPADFAQYEQAIRLYRDRGGEPALAGRVRVLLTGVPLPHGAERVLNVIESSGGVVVAMENCTGLKPILEDVDAAGREPLAALAEKYFHLPCSVMTPNRRRLDSLRTLVQQYRPQCVIELIWQACLTYDVEAHHVRRVVEEELGLPYLRLSTDYSPADSPRLAVRVEALLETVRARVTR